MIYKTVLDNGLTLVLDNIPDAKTVTIKYVVAAGALDEQGSYVNENNYGVAHFLEHMSFKGTEKRTYEDINNDIAAIGGYTNAYTDRDETVYYISSPADKWKENLEILSDLFWNSTIPEEEFNKERTVIIEELKMINDDPRSKVIEQLYELIYERNDNRKYVAGTIDTVKNLTVEDLKKFKKCFYNPNNVLLVAAGNFPKDEFIAEAVSLIGNKEEQIQSGREIEYNNEVFNNRLLRRSKNDLEQAHFAFIIKGVPFYDEQYIVMDIIADLLGSSFIGRLYKIIREQMGLAYTVAVSSASMRDAGYLDGYIGLDAKNIKAVHKVVATELNRLKKELVSNEELTMLKAQYKGHLLLGMEPTSAKTTIHEDNFINGTNYTIDEILEKIDAVIPEDIKQFAQKYFQKNNIAFSVIEPKIVE